MIKINKKFNTNNNKMQVNPNNQVHKTLDKSKLIIFKVFELIKFNKIKIFKA